MSVKTDLQNETYADLKEEEYSFQAILKKVTQGDFNVATGGRSITYEEHSCYIIYKSPGAAKALPKYVELSEGDKVCICAAKGIEPLIGDQLLIGPELNDIKLSFDISAGTQALFTLVIRK